jgi:hypothetical protein
MWKLFLSTVAIATASQIYAGSSDIHAQEAAQTLRLLKTIRTLSDATLIVGLGLTAAILINEPSCAALSATPGCIKIIAAAIAYFYHASSVSVATRIVIYGYSWQFAKT